MKTFKCDYAQVQQSPDATTVIEQLDGWFTHYNTIHTRRSAIGRRGSSVPWSRMPRPFWRSAHRGDCITGRSESSQLRTATGQNEPRQADDLAITGLPATRYRFFSGYLLTFFHSAMWGLLSP